MVCGEKRPPSLSPGSQKNKKNRNKKYKSPEEDLMFGERVLGGTTKAVCAIRYKHAHAHIHTPTMIHNLKLDDLKFAFFSRRISVGHHS